MLFKSRGVRRRRGPGGRFIASKKAAAPGSFALPVDARVLQRSGGEVVDDGGDALLAAQAIEERQLALGPGREAIGAPLRCFALLPLPSSGNLLFLGHALCRALIGFAASRGKKVVLFPGGLAAAASHRHAEDGR